MGACRGAGTGAGGMCAVPRGGAAFAAASRESHAGLRSSGIRLPGWTADRVDQAWPALLHSCQRPATGWAALCADAVKLQPRSERDVRRWLEQNLQPYSIQPLQGSSPGLLTGYYEPVLTTSRRATAKFRYPLYGVPADLAQRRPYWTRQQIDTLPAAQASLRGRETRLRRRSARGPGVAHPGIGSNDRHGARRQGAHRPTRLCGQ